MKEKKTKNKRKWVWVGTILGGIWGFTNFSPLTVAIIRKNQLLGDLFSIPIAFSGILNREIFHFHIDSIQTLFILPLLIGTCIGLFCGWVLDKIIKR